jgi:hypothetical protein
LSFFSSDQGVTFPLEKQLGNCHITYVIISSTNVVHYNVHHSKSMVQKLGFSHGSIAINDELILLIIEGEWLESKFLMQNLF